LQFLRGYAADIWAETAPELHRMRMLTAVDVASLSAYCHAYGTWRVALEALDRMAKNDPHMSALVIKARSGDPVPNPMVAIARKAAGDMLRFATEFGLTSAARSRLAAAGWEPPDGGSKFHGLLKG
jgi:P27 family predicted phage terminase small subunit